MALLEYNGFPKSFLHAAGLLLVFGRIIHIEFGLNSTTSTGPARVFGAASVLILGVVFSITNLYYALTQHIL